MKTTKLLMILFAVAALCARAVLSYGSSEEAIEFSDDSDKLRIAVILKSFSSEYWGYVEQGCIAYENGDQDVQIDFENPSSSIASDEQRVILQTNIDSGKYDGFVIAAIDEELIGDIIFKTDTCAVAVASKMSQDYVIRFVGTDNVTASYAGAKKACEIAGELGWDEIRCAIIGGKEDEQVMKLRLTGLSQGIIENEGEFLSEEVQYTNEEAEEGRDAMDRIMDEHPEGLSIVACYNDELAIAALEEAKENSAYKDTVFIGFDGNGSTCAKILEDDDYKNMVVVAQNPYEMGYRAMLEIVSYLRSDFDEDSDWFIDSGYSVITKGTANERMVQIQSHLS